MLDKDAAVRELSMTGEVIADEQAWLEQASKGDKVAFGHLVEAYQTPVYNLAYRMLGSASEAEDAAQETFLTAWRKLDTYRARAPFEHWLTRVCLNCCYERLRKRRVREFPLNPAVDPAGRAVEPGRYYRIMEVCGGHTHSIFQYGIETMLPASIEMVHGPGCPVCVLPMGVVDDCVAIAERPGVVFATFGDAMRVPGTKKSLMQAKADGAEPSEVTPIEREATGAVDFRARQEDLAVTENELLVTVHPPAEGEPGQDLFGRALLDRDRSAVRRCQIDRRGRRRNHEPDTVVPGRDGQAIGTDLVGKITVRCNTVCSHHDFVNLALRHQAC